MSNWPNLFIAGAPRSGTSSLDAYFQAIPCIFMSRIKEPNFFSRTVIADDHPMVSPIRDERQYLDLFATAGDARYRGEASPNYLEDPEAPALIERLAPGSRVIASLRDPVERLFSQYLMTRNVRPMDSFDEEVERGLRPQGDRSRSVLSLATGLYATQVDRYRTVFGPRFKVLIFEEWTADVPGTMQELLEFLGIEHDVSGFSEPPQRQHAEVRGPLARFLFGNLAIARAAEALIPYRLRKGIRNTLLVKPAAKPGMNPATRDRLVRYYRDDVRHLEAMLGRDLPWPNFSPAGRA
jgi:hypothetical protein